MIEKYPKRLANGIIIISALNRDFGISLSISDLCPIFVKCSFASFSLIYLL
jgi:hypothetical protein